VDAVEAEFASVRSIAEAVAGSGSEVAIESGEDGRLENAGQRDARESSSIPSGYDMSQPWGEQAFRGAEFGWAKTLERLPGGE
jgi:hypothetical protein